MRYHYPVSLGLITSLLAVGTFAEAQNSEPSKPSYENVVYLNNGRTYVQKSLPLYLNFSTSPGGKQYELKSEATPQYTNPMYLDTEGVNYIRSKWAVDPSTGRTAVPQQEVLYELFADGLSPQTSLKLSGAPRYSRGGVTYYGVGLNAALTSRDAVSGVKKTQYALEGNYQDYSSDFAISTEGAKVLYYYAADNVGNAEATKSRKFTVDLTSPNSSSEIVGIVHNGNIMAPSARFKLSYSDALSGVASTWYSYDDGGKRPYGSPASPAALSDGDHTFYYYSIDHVKNEESRKSFKFYLDKIPPVVEYTIQGDLYEGNYKYISPRTRINLTSTDNKAGVESTDYRIDGGQRVTFTSPVAMPERTGVHTLLYDATDNVKNRSRNKTLTVYMDNRNPTTGIDYKTPQFFDRDTLFINKNTNIVLFFSDGQSGIQKTEYAIDGGSFQPYSKFTIPQEGFHTITFRSTDRVNNVEQTKSSEVFVDNSSPEIHHHFSIKPIGSKNKGGKSVSIYPNYTRLYLGATDTYSGTDKITYSMNGGPFQAYSSPYTLDMSEVTRFKKNKFHTVVIRAEDKLGNQSEKTIEFFVGRE